MLVVSPVWAVALVGLAVVPVFPVVAGFLAGMVQRGPVLVLPVLVRRARQLGHQQVPGVLGGAVFSVAVRVLAARMPRRSVLVLGDILRRSLRRIPSEVRHLLPRGRASV
ncbi:hypothetical protein D9V34_09470 [Mycetocola lacteus]|uniref:Uncharacterized protein n=1 Tax=Mycetocola lacteus TaxID=76637 RepID=A0A3L7ARL4_9MICO|nr:hypothetical protein D9V34_09470 [Mycetocola lacteus]